MPPHSYFFPNSPNPNLGALFLAILMLTGCFFEKSNKSLRNTNPVGVRPLLASDVQGLERVKPSQTVELKDGDTLRLTVAPVKKNIGGHEIRMFAYNGMIPGPLIRVQEGASITVLLKNRLGFSTSLHSHGVRMESRFDGTPGDTLPAAMAAIADGAQATYSLRFPDPGMFWYHSHIREDYSQELGLFGNYWVIPKDTMYWAPIDREVVLMINDVLMDSQGVAPFHTDAADYAMMGRFGNTFLINGDTTFRLEVKRKERVRFYITNACNTRVLNLGLNNHLVQLMGSDNGRFERPLITSFNYLAPGERMIFEAYFQIEGTGGNPDSIELIHSTPKGEFVLGMIHVLPDTTTSGKGSSFWNQDTSMAAVHSIDPYRQFFDHLPDQELLFTVRMGGHAHSSQKAGAKTSAVQHDPVGKGIEWDDHMGASNANVSSDEITWIIRDTKTGLENMDIHWSLHQGEPTLIRIYNDSTSMHPMPHPIHFHGQRFLVISSNGIKNTQELGWKDTYLVGRGETVDLLLDADNPGEWMAHCHIASHLEAMMMFHYSVLPKAP
jgi:suppressor of ftsI